MILYKTKHTKLLELEGWYDIQPSIPEFLSFYHEKWKNSKSKLKFTRFLAREGVDNNIISELGKEVRTSFKLSCRHKDFLRAGESAHYTSCYAVGCGYDDMPHVLANDPNVALLYVPDKSGDFMLRTFVRLVKQKDASYALVIVRWYGNGPRESIIQTLNNVIPVYIADHMGNTLLYSPCKSDLNIEGYPRSPSEIRIYNDYKLYKTKKKKLGILV